MARRDHSVINPADGSIRAFWHALNSFALAPALLILFAPLPAVADVIAGDLDVGRLGPQNFVQIPDERTITGDLQIGIPFASTYTMTNKELDAARVNPGWTGMGTFTMNGGQVNTDYENIGWRGTGIFNHNGGINDVEGIIYLGSHAAGTYLGRNYDKAHGTYNLNSGGELEVGNLVPGEDEIRVGNGGDGVFNHNDGSVTAEDIYLGYFSSSVGAYTLTKGVVAVGDDLVVGRSGKGTFEQKAGTMLTIDDTLYLGDSENSNSHGTFTYHGGTLLVGKEQLGDEGTGIFNHLAGTHQVKRQVEIGQDDGGDGTYNMTKGLFQVGTDNVSGDNYLSVGQEGKGVFNQHDVAAGVNSQVTVSGTLYLGDDDSDANGTYNLGRNTKLTSNEAQIGDEGIGVFNHKGTHNVAGILYIGQEDSGVGTYNLQEGALTATTLSIGRDGKGTFNQSGNSSAKISSLLFLGSDNDGFFQSGGTFEADRAINSGLMEITGGSFKLTGGDFNNLGTFNFENAASPITGPGTFINQGTVGSKGDTTFAMGYESRDGAIVIARNGTLTLKGETATPTPGQTFGKHAGTNTFELLSGGKLNLTDTHTFTGNVTINGNAEENALNIGTLTIANDATVSKFTNNAGKQGKPNSGLQLKAGDEIRTLGKGLLSNKGAMTADGGKLIGDDRFRGFVPQEAMENVQGGHILLRSLTLRTGALVNEGTISTDRPTPSLVLESGWLQNGPTGIMNLTDGFSLTSSQYRSSDGYTHLKPQFFNAGGTVRKTGTGLATIDVTTIFDRGKIHVVGGTLRFDDNFHVQGLSEDKLEILIDKGAILDFRKSAANRDVGFNSGVTIQGEGIFKTKGYNVGGQNMLLNMTGDGKAIIDGNMTGGVGSNTLNKGNVDWQAGDLTSFVNDGNLDAVVSGSGCTACKFLGAGFVNKKEFNIASGIEVGVAKVTDANRVVTNRGFLHLRGVMTAKLADVTAKFLNDTGGLFEVIAANGTRGFNGVFENKGTLLIAKNTKFNLLNIVQPNLIHAGADLILRNGTWIVENGGELVLGNANVRMTRNEAKVILHGNAKFSPLPGLGDGSGAQLVNAGMLRLSSSAAYFTQGLFHNDGGTLTIDKGSKMSASGGFRATNGAKHKIDGELSILGNLVNDGGKFHGKGVIKVDGVINKGIWSPGASPGIMAVAGDYTNASGGVLEIEIAGTEVDTLYDRLVVDGTAFFEAGSRIDIMLLNPDDFDSDQDLFMPGIGDVFDIMIASEFVFGPGVSSLISLFDFPILMNGRMFNAMIAGLGNNQQALRLVVGGNTTDVTEPPSIAILFGGLLLVWRQRRRQKDAA